MEQSFKIGFTLWIWFESAKKPGLYHLKERNYIDGKVTYEKTNIWLTKDQWDDIKEVVKECHPDHKTLNIRLRKSLRDRGTKIDKAVINDLPVTHELFTKSSITLETLIKNSYYRKNADYLWDLMCGFRTGGLHFRDLNTDTIRSFQNWLLESKAHSTACVNMFMVRSLCQKAKDMGMILINPFHKFGDYVKSPVLEDVEKAFLFEEERDAVYDFFITLRNYYRIWPDLIKPRKKEGKGYFQSNYCSYKSLVYFLLGCFTGIRISDWKAFDVETRVQDDGYLRLRARKNGEWVCQEIGEKLRNVLDEIKVIGKLDIAESTIRRKIQEFIDQLKINKKVGPHTARHTYGCLCAKMGVPKDVAKELMGISSDAIDVYYRIMGITIKEYSKMMAH